MITIPDPLPPFLTPQEVATLLRVDKRTVLNWLRAGKLKGVRFGRTWHIPSGQLTQDAVQAPFSGTTMATAVVEHTFSSSGRPSVGPSPAGLTGWPTEPGTYLLERGRWTDWSTTRNETL